MKSARIRSARPTVVSAFASAGFTLMEMLVTLVLFSVLSALLWQALGTLGRVETRLADSSLLVTEDALYAEWLRQALRGLSSGAQGDPRKMTGNTAGLSGYTSMPPWPGGSGPEFMQLQLRPAGAGGTVLIARQADSTRDWPLWTWQGSGSFAYLDEEGVWQDRWPPLLGKHEVLPSAIRLDAAGDLAVLVAIPARDNPMLRRQLLERQ